MLDRGIYGCPERVAPEDDYKEKVPTASENRYTTVQKSYMTFDIHKFVYD